MAEPDWEEVERLFDAALGQPAPDRLAWLARATDNPGLRDVVARMLVAHASPGPLDRPLDAAPLGVRDRLTRALTGRYALGEEIGRGGMATVFLAREEKHDRPVVLKVLNPAPASGFGAERFLAEIQVAAKLSHPHILALLDSGEADGLLYYVMPWIGGETLRGRLRRDGRLPLPSLLRILHDLADALATAHRAGIVHRDLKPENVLCVGDHAYLLDFGIAQLRLTDEQDRLTGQGAVVGTMGYMAPEQEAGARTDYRVDLFSWGVLARELLTGQPPGIFGSILPETLPVETPAPLSAMLQRCLAADPADRPAAMDEVVQALAGLLQPDGAAAPAPPTRMRRVLWPALAGLGVLAAAGWGLTRRAPEPVPLARLPLPVAVAPLVNETGDSSLAMWGRMAGDWITQGLQETGVLTVVPWPNAREAAERRPAGGDPASLMRAETGAGTVITGSYYLVGDRIRFQAQITDATKGTLLAYPEPAEARRDSAALALRLLRGRVMGALAIRQDERVADIPGLAERPPTFEAYRAFDRGLGFHLAQEYDSAAAAFLQAYALDTTFSVALIQAAFDLWNTDQFAAVDSTLRLLQQRRMPLSEYHDQLAQYLQALLAGQGERALATIRRASELAPDHRGLYAHAWMLNATNRPAEALQVLVRIEAERGGLRRWSPYWTQRAHAEHRLGDFAAELRSARRMQAEHPESRQARVLEVRAAAATGDTRLVDSLLEAQASLSPDTYWSQGAATVVAGEELEAHGRAFVSPRYYTRAVRWLANQLARAPHHRAHRYWMGTALYDAGRWPEAEPYFESLANDFPERLQYRGLRAFGLARAGRHAAAEQALGPRPPYNPGEHTVARARLAAIAGRKEAAIALLGQAVSESYDGLPWLHTVAFRDFSVLVGNPGYEALMFPAGSR